MNRQELRGVQDFEIPEWAQSALNTVTTTLSPSTWAKWAIAQVQRFDDSVTALASNLHDADQQAAQLRAAGAASSVNDTVLNSARGIVNNMASLLQKARAARDWIRSNFTDSDLADLGIIPAIPAAIIAAVAAVAVGAYAYSQVAQANSALEAQKQAMAYNLQLLASGKKVSEIPGADPATGTPTGNAAKTTDWKTYFYYGLGGVAVLLVLKSFLAQKDS